MQTERWRQINLIFDLAVALAPDAREQCVRDAAGGDDALAAEVLSLLAADSPDGTSTHPSARPTTPIEFSEDWSGETIGKYRIVKKIGAGGMGVVYSAYDEESGAMVALKTLQRRANTAFRLDRLKEEFRIFQGLSHPNLVALHEMVAAGDRWFFTMELIEGGTFLDHVRGDAPSRIARLRDALQQLAGAVAALHAAGKLHRDLKPANVLVTGQGAVKVLDFGLGVRLDSAGMHDNTEDHIFGSLPYMSPEQTGGGTVTAASDWYSVGVMLYEALTGQFPFAGPPLKMLRAKQHDDGPAPADINPDVPEDLNALAVELLRRDPARRPSAASILVRLGTRLERAAPLEDGLFVGRREELRRLQQAYERARRAPIVVLVNGRPGAGKTSLVERFLSEVSDDPEAVVLRGRCLEQESVPFKALDGLIGSLVHRLCRMKRERLDLLMPRDIRVLARLFPVLERVPRVAEAPVVGTSDPEPADLRNRAAAALRELLARLADRHPLVLFIDDLQWGDRDSASLLIDILTPPYAPNFLNIGCYRSEDAAESPFLTAMQEFRTRAPLPYAEEHVAVGELDEEEARDLARRILRARDHGSDELADAIARESAGRPFLVHELVEQFTSSGEDRYTRPLGLTAALWRRIETLPAEKRTLLEVVAIAGRPIRGAEAFRAAGLTGTDAAAVHSLKAGRLIRGTPVGLDNRIEVYHDLVRAAILKHLPPASVEHHHRRLARVFSAAEKADPEVLAFHLSRGGLTEEAAGHYARAAAKAAESLAFEHAAMLYRQALQSKPWAIDQERDLRARLGDALNAAGRGAEAAKEFLAAAAHAEPKPGLDLQHRASLALLTSGHVDAGLACLAPVMKSIGMRVAGSPYQALVALLARRGQLRVRGLNFTERDEESIDREQLRRIDVGWSVVLGLSIIDPIRGASLQTRNLIQALDAGEPVRVARALAVEAAHLASSGSFARARDVLARADRLALRLQQPYTSGMVELARGAVAYFGERWSDTVRMCRAAAATFRQHCTGTAWEIDTANAFILWSLVKMGSIAELYRICPALLKEARDRGDLYAIANLSTQIMTLVRLAEDNPESARNELNLVMSQWSQAGYHVQHHDALLALVPLELYVANYEAAWNRVQTQWKAFRRSLLSQVQDLRIEMLQLRGYCAVAMAGQSPAKSELLESASRDAKLLRRERLPWTIGFSEYLAGTVAYQRGDFAASRAHLTASVNAFESVEAGLEVAVTRHRLAIVSPPEEGARLRDTATAWLREQGVVNIDRMVRAFAPGFSDSPPVPLKSRESSASTG